MRKIGLTGGIGSGKSTVSALLAARGAGVIDADAISRSTTAAHGAALPAIAAEFGPEFVTADNAMDRERMRALVFQNTAAKKRLEAIIHPLVGQEIQRASLAFAAAGKSWAVYDIPLLVESAHWRTQLDRVLVVDCTAPTQIARIEARSGLKVEVIKQIMAQQATRQDRLAAADWVIFNDGIDLQDLSTQVAQLSAQFGL